MVSTSRFFKIFTTYAFFASFCSVALCIETYRTLKIPLDHYLLLFVFLATLSYYNLHYFLANFLWKNDINSTNGFRHLSPHLLILAIASVAGFFVFLDHPFNAELIFSSILMSFCYSIPFTPIAKHLNLNKWGFVKTFLLAFTWTFVTCLFPVGNIEILKDHLFLLFFAQRFIFLLILCIMFEQKDFITDSLKGLNSMATQVSPYSLKIFTCILFIIWAGLNFAFLPLGLSPGYAWSKQLLLVIVFMVYLISERLTENWFYYFIVDGMMILSALLTFLTTE